MPDQAPDIFNQAGRILLPADKSALPAQLKEMLRLVGQTLLDASAEVPAVVSFQGDLHPTLARLKLATDHMNSLRTPLDVYYRNLPPFKK